MTTVGHRKRSTLRTALVLFASALALLVAWLSDDRVSELANQPISSGQVNAVLRAMRCWGEGATLVLVAVAVGFAQPQRWREPIYWILITLTCAGIVDGIKPAFGRRRPFEVDSGQVGSGRNSSFPSGHTATAFAFARSLSLAHPVLQPVCLTAATGTAISRIYDKRHYPSDCVAGALLSWYLATLLWRGFSRLDRHLVQWLDRSEEQKPLESSAARRAA